MRIRASAEHNYKLIINLFKIATGTIGAYLNRRRELLQLIINNLNRIKGEDPYDIHLGSKVDELLGWVLRGNTTDLVSVLLKLYFVLALFAFDAVSSNGASKHFSGQRHKSLLCFQREEDMMLLLIF